MKQIDYYYWINSDWAYLGADRLRVIAEKHKATIRYMPVRLKQIYARTGGVSLRMRSKERQNYRVVELKRWCDYLKFPISAEPKYLTPDDEAASGLVVAAMHAGHSPHELSNAIFRAQWVEERDVSDRATLIDIALSCGLDGPSLLDAALTPEVKAELDRNTEEAISRGVFGSPAYFVAGEHFWGQDRLDWVDRALAQIDAEA